MAKTIYYREGNRPLAQQLRREMTQQEKHLWYDFLKSHPAQFRRQKQFGNYIVDFYCAKHKLVIEIDGSQHYDPEEKAYDRQRTAYLNGLGLRVERFTNHDIDAHFNEVCAMIHKLIHEDI